MNIYKVKKLPEEPKNPCEGCMQFYKGVCSRGEDCYTKKIYDGAKALYAQFLAALKPVGAEEITKLHNEYNLWTLADGAWTKGYIEIGEFIVKKLTGE